MRAKRMRIAVTTGAAVAVFGVVHAPAALADRPQAPGKGQPSPTASCKQLRAGPAAWAAFQAATPSAQGKTFSQHFGGGRESRALARCVAWRARARTEAPQDGLGQAARDGTGPQPVAKAPEPPAAPLEVAEACKAILAGRQTAPKGTSYRNIGDCLEDYADRDDRGRDGDDDD